jgi:subtilisin family serine protease
MTAGKIFTLIRSAGVAAAVLGSFASFDSAAAQSRAAILMPDSAEAGSSDFLARTKKRIGSGSTSAVTTTSPEEAVAIARNETAKGRKVIPIGFGRGTIDVARALAAGAQVNGVVLVSGAYDEVRSQLGSPALLPRTLAIHHRADACDLSPPSAVPSFVKWADGKVAVQWLNNRGPPAPDPCASRSAHGFFMRDGSAVAAINGFIRSR